LEELNNGTYNTSTKIYEDDLFSIDVVEYYDTTTYLNIESDLPSIKTGTTTSGSYYTLSSWIDDSFIAQSAEVEVPIEVDIMTPCSMFVKSFNNRFWENNFLTISPNDSDNEYSDIIDYYSQYISELNKVTTYKSKVKILDEIINPLLDDVWNTFALSGISDNTELSSLYVEYLGSDVGKNQIRNIQNSIFPTIAAASNISGLIQLENYIEKDLLYLAKPYYENTIPRIKEMTRYIMKMHNDDGIGINGWKKTYVLMHGYNSFYENSKNVSELSPAANKLIDVDGPWIYTALQEFLYDYYDKISNNLNRSGTNIIDDNYELIKSIITPFVKKYCNLIDSNYFDEIINQFCTYWYKIIDNADHTSITNCVIDNYQSDAYNAQFTLFKSTTYETNSYFSYDLSISLDQSDYVLSLDNYDSSNTINQTSEAAGEIWVRLPSYPLSIPLTYSEDDSANNNDLDILSVTDNKNTEYLTILKEMTNNCIKFGIFDNMMWILGYTVYETLGIKSKRLKLCSLTYTHSNNKLMINADSIKFFSANSDLDYLQSINEFVGVDFNEDTNIFSVFLYDINAQLLYLSKNKSELSGSVDKVTLQFYQMMYDINDYKISSKILFVFSAISSSSQTQIKFEA